jgi:hypothetical protein
MDRNNARKVDAYLYRIYLQHLSTACIYSMYRTDGVEQGVDGPEQRVHPRRRLGPPRHPHLCTQPASMNFHRKGGLSALGDKVRRSPPAPLHKLHSTAHTFQGPANIK